MPILALDKSTVKLITSTQVITSVSSVVKELVENSLDADAKNIEVNLSDNGLSVTDVPNMALPHSTSKISDFGDLDSLKTYGFRGEALNAICKVSAEVSVTTKTSNDDTAKIYTLDSNGCVTNVELSPRLDGTTVRVKKLFDNIRVRRQMISDQKKSKLDIKCIDNLLKSFSVSNPPVRISFRVNNSLVFLKPSCLDVREALRHFLGSKVCANLEWIEHEDSEIKIQLMIPKKNTSEYRLVYEASEQFVIVNKRPVKYKQFEKIINDRIYDHFGDKAPSRKRAVYFLSIAVSSDEIDVNLEPNKTSVILKNQDSISSKLDKLLLDYYNISDENSKPDNSGLDISIDGTSEYHDISNSVKTVEIEAPHPPPACKKLKLNNCREKARGFIIYSNGDSDSKRKSAERRKTDCQNLSEDIQNERIFPISDRDSVDRILNTFPGPDLSDSDGESNVVKESGNNLLKVGHAARPAISSPGENRGRDFGPESNLESSESFAFSPDDVVNGTVFEGINETNVVDDEVETLSQLPVVDLGEDFDIEAILERPRSERITVKREIISEQEINCENDNRIKDIDNKEKPKVTLELWSKGHIPGLKGSTDVSVLTAPKSRPTDKKDVEASSQTIYHTGFSKFSHEIRSQVMQENPGAALPTIGKIFASRWKELSPEERGFYRDLALDEKRKAETEKKKLKDDKITQQESERNKARLVKMLEGMKKTKTTKKCPFNERTTVPWQITVQTVTENFFSKKTSEPVKIIGRLNEEIWALKSDENICVISSTEVFKAKGQLKDIEGDENIFNEKENAENILSSLLRDNKLSDRFYHPIHRIGSTSFQQIEK